MKSSRRKLFLTLMTALITSCSISNENLFTKEVSTLPDYRLNTGEIISIKIADRQLLTTEISETGNISLPTIGQISAVGLTTNELAQQISSRWRGTNRPPPVTVSVYQFREGDTVSIDITGIRGFNVTTRIDPSGTLFHPQLGEIPAASLTKVALEQLIIAKLTETGQTDNPKVSINLLGNQTVTTLSNQKATVKKTVAETAAVKTVAEKDSNKSSKQFGPFFVSPEINISLLYDSNVFRSAQHEQSSFVLTLDPKLKLERNWRGNKYALNLGSPIGIYANSSSDNYIDTQLGAQTEWQLPRSLALGLKSEYLTGHDRRGATDRPDLGEPNTWYSLGVNGVVSYGKKQARARLEVAAGYLGKRYDKFALPEKLDDRNQMNLATTLYYQVLPKTYLTGEIQYLNTDYTSAMSTIDSNQLGYSLGVLWQATAKTSANLKIGYLNRDYEDNRHQDFSGLHWNIGLQWQPQSTSQFSLTTSKSVEDATGIGDYIATQSVGASWRYQWSPRIFSSASMAVSNQEFGGSLRSDDLLEYGVNVNYQFRKWLNLGAGVQFDSRDSSLSLYNYDRNVFSLMMRANF